MKLPEAFVQKMTTSLGLEAPAFFESLTKHSPVSVRLNPLKPTLKFSENFSIPWCKEGYYLEKRPSFTLDPLFHAGAYYVQEAKIGRAHV